MKLRKLTSALVAAGALSSPWALGLGLGDITLKSSLNQPLQAEIKLLQTRELAEEEVLPSLAAQEEFDRAGVERFFFLSNIDFDVKLSGAGDGVLLLTTKQTIQEPFLNFLVEVNWPNGRVLREYTVLLDPPVYEDEAPEIVVTPQTSAPTQAIMDAEKAAAKTTNSQAVVTPVASSTSSNSSGGTYGPVGSSDTLWNIALEVRPDRSVSVQQTMMAIRELNPNAFVGGNINKIKKGSVLRVPTLDQIQDWSEGSAVKEVAKHNQRYQQSIHSDTAGQIQLSGVDQSLQSNVMEPDEARLKIVRSEDASASSGSASGDQAGTDAEVETLQNELAITQENLDKANRENEKLAARLEALEERMSKLSRLVTLKDSQMAELQMTMSDQDMPEETLSESQDMEMSEAAVSESSGMMDAEMPMEGMDESMPEEMMADGSMADEAMEESAMVEDGAMVDGATVDEAMPEDASEMTEVEPEAPVQAEVTPPPSDKPVIKLDEQYTPVSQPKQGLIETVLGNPVWLIAIGAGSLLFVILLFMMSRRSYQRENELADVVEQNPTDGKSSMDIADEELSTIDEELDSLDLESQGFGQVSLDGDTNLDVDDVIARADSYIAYGQFDNAVGVLEEAINNEPSRIDLRLKMLEVCAETQNTQGFERQKQEILNLGAEDVSSQIRVLEQKLPGSMGEAATVDAFDSGDSLLVDQGADEENDEFSYSLEDLESELASDLSGDSLTESSMAEESDDLDELEFNLDEELGLNDSAAETSDFDVSASADEYSLDMDLGTDEVSENVSASGDEFDSLGDLELDGFDSDLDASLESSETAQLDSLAEEAESEDSFAMDPSLDLEQDADELSLDDMPVVEDNVLEAPSEGSLDMSDLGSDDLLAKESAGDLSVSEVASDADSDLDMDDLEDLAKSLGVDSADEVDLDAELASASEVTPSLDLAEETPVESFDVESTEEITDDFALNDLEESTDLELDSADDLSALAESSEEFEVPEEISEQDSALEDTSFDELSLDESVALDSDSASEVAFDESAVEESAVEESIAEESDLDADVKSTLNEEELDFYVGADEVATKLDLARAYVDMGDIDGAKDILEEVIVEGNEDQKTEATDLLNGLS
ncbi:FimV/HubP family polar landmark protein [Litoribrevibacter albus]|uniref:Motility protein FimV n=1 Tax=Litoribrevibacter albus TaxID=1473156 RepID=A0AA37S9L6_9GAMM|nr:FimV/HubP family polar landmark protein [Litoribrevibacter albus]GLQ30938.1 motility protein FimV [Litoribrevibacter albus]